jgi:glycosyltransferase involved in cell wall biosynthesis
VLAAYQALRARGAPVELHVAFGGVADELRRLPGLRVVVPANDTELAAFYRSLDVMLAPGLIQLGAPHYPAMEAMACGVPLVTTGYMPADADNSWLVPVAHTGAIVAAVGAILADPEEARRRAARGLEAMRPFAWARVAADLLAQITRTG